MPTLATDDLAGRVRARDPRHVAEGSARRLQWIVSLDPGRPRVVEEDVREDVRQVAHRGEDAVVRAGKPLTLQQRIRECLELMGAAPLPAGSDELNNIEYFLAYLSNGLTLKANAARP